MGMYDFDRFRKQGAHFEKLIRWVVIFVFFAIVFAWIGHEVVAAYFVKNPDILNSWIGQLIDGFIQ